MAHAALVAIDSDHDHKPIGRLIYAEVGIDQALRSVAVLDTDRFATIDRPVYFSGEFEMRGDVDKSFYVAREAAMRGLSVTLEPATLGLTPIKSRAGDLRSSVDRGKWPMTWRSNDRLLARALGSLGSGLGVEHRAATRIVDQRSPPLPAARAEHETTPNGGVPVGPPRP